MGWYRMETRKNDIKILVIDDNEMNLDVICMLLQQMATQIDTAQSGEEGLAKAENKVYDMIFLDDMMPGIDGTETLRRLRSMKSAKEWEHETPVIALTANVGADVREKYQKAGFTDYMAKPVEYDVLVSILQTYLQGHRREEQSQESSQESLKEEMLSCVEALEQYGIHARNAVRYTDGKWKRYFRILEMFAGERGRAKQAEIVQAYETADWKDYAVYVHGLKNGARTIGADRLADMAYEHELHSKQKDIVFLQESYHRLIQEWEHTRAAVLSGLALLDTEHNSISAQQASAWESADKWQEIREQIIQKLREYKKKEAAMLLEKALEHSREQEKIRRVMDAVMEYDYEHAIQLLGDM